MNIRKLIIVEKEIFYLKNVIGKFESQNRKKHFKAEKFRFAIFWEINLKKYFHKLIIYTFQTLI